MGDEFGFGYRLGDRVDVMDLVQMSSTSVLSSRFFGRLKLFAIFDPIDSIFHSIRSISRLVAVVDRLGYALVQR